MPLVPITNTTGRPRPNCRYPNVMAPARMVRTGPSKAAAPEGVELGTTVAGGADWAAAARPAQTTELDPTTARVASTEMALTAFRSRLFDSPCRHLPWRCCQRTGRDR